MKNIILLGFMGAGKTAIGKRVAEKLEMGYLDIDELIEKEAGMPIGEIFSRFGEEHFRTLESKMAGKVSLYSNKVIATGGGIVLKKGNLDNLRRGGLLICLTARPEVLLERTKKEHHRPLLKVDYPLTTIKELLAYRAPFYAQADHCLDTSDLTIEEGVEEVARLAKEVK